MADSISPWPLVRKGDRDHPVRTLQYLLRAREHPVGVDGIFGPRTDAAVRAFQGEKNLVVDGDRRTRDLAGAGQWDAVLLTERPSPAGRAVTAGTVR
jgi:peptidoglycan hydrolase-like protein with peptidoglycan-binding domain